MLCGLSYFACDFFIDTAASTRVHICALFNQYKLGFQRSFIITKNNQSENRVGTPVPQVA